MTNRRHDNLLLCFEREIGFDVDWLQERFAIEVLPHQACEEIQRAPGIAALQHHTKAYRATSTLCSNAVRVYKVAPSCTTTPLRTIISITNNGQNAVWHVVVVPDIGMWYDAWVCIIDGVDGLVWEPIIQPPLVFSLRVFS